MGAHPTKAAGNMYYQCRKQAALYNDKLNSREGAAELLNISPSTLADYELGLTKVVPVDKVVLMADTYNAPELRNYYCTNECPIGRDSVPKLEVRELDRLTIKVLAAFNETVAIKQDLINIAEDGVITDNEIPILKKILDNLDKLSISAQELKLWAEKTILSGNI